MTPRWWNAFLAAVLLCISGAGGTPSKLSEADLGAISERGILPAGYDMAARHATDVVMAQQRGEKHYEQRDEQRADQLGHWVKSGRPVRCPRALDCGCGSVHRSSQAWEADHRRDDTFACYAAAIQRQGCFYDRISPHWQAA
jgi:hypothetical protein